MVDAVLTIALETVRDLLSEEARFLFNVKSEVEELGTELKRMRDFLERADGNERLSYRVTEIRGLAAEVEDVLETFSIEVASHKSKRGIKRALKRSACIVNECVTLHKIGSEIVSIKTKLANFTNSLPAFEIPKGENSDSTQERQEQWRNYPHFEDDFVGMDDDINQLVRHLVNEENMCRVVSICGMGGLGKTSLAKKCYKHDEVRKHFRCYAWVCISQQFKKIDVLQEILERLNPQKNKEDIRNMRVQELFEQIYDVQQKEKCLIVIDDIWSIDAWDCLNQAFPIGKTHTGSKILLTTRDKQVASHADPGGFLHEPQCLGEEESWELLRTKAFQRRDMGTEYKIDPRMEELGREMVRQCKGLPLAVVVLGGILATRHKPEEWEKVHKDVKAYLARGEGVSGKNGRGVLSILELSYNSLPYRLKPCFLFLANLPEDSDIIATKLYHLWTAERIVSSDDRKKGQTMMDVAEDYLFELAQRCMVQVSVKNTRIIRRFKSCRLHDLMRELCLTKVKEENFLKLIGSGVGNIEEYSASSSSNIPKTRRLAIHSNDDVGEYKMYREKQRARHVRSLLFFNIKGPTFWFKIEDNINYFKLLSVLYLEGVDMHGKELPKGIGKTRQLRYLNLRGTRLKKLPSSIGELGYLETLDLRNNLRYVGVVIPNVLWKLQRLRHLYLPGVILFDDGEKEKKLLRLDGLNNLETLVCFHSDYFYAKDLLKLNNLRKLVAIVQTKCKDLDHLATAVSSPNSLLRQFKLSIEDCSFQSEEDMNVLRKLIGCHHLNKLGIQGPVSKLPEHCHFSPNLTKLVLVETRLEDDPMPTLGKLPSLVELSIGRYVFMGKEMVCSATHFLQLTSLMIWDLTNLENWRVDQGAFPKLSKLEIDNCRKLKMIPDGFAFLTALKELSINGTSKELVERLEGVDGKEGEDYHKVKHIPSIRIDWIPLRFRPQ